MMRWGRFAAAYVGMGIIAAVIAVIWRAGSPFLYPEPWLAFTPLGSHAYSAALGVTFGALIVFLTRACVGRFHWARRLHRELRPLARGISATGIVTLAILSALGEELLFRGLLQPWLGLVPQALLFGLLHQVSGPSRWVWVGWASLVGLAFGAMFELTGSLIGPIAAHAVVNALNLSYLKSHDPEPRRRPLGGLLGQRG
jgi:hypothetical protein